MRPPETSHGVDVDAEGRGRIETQRLYQLVRQPAPIVDRTIEVHFDEPGAQVDAFTFG